MSEIREELGERVSELEMWGVRFGRLATRVEFEVYGNAVQFANRVFDLSEEMEKYPEVRVVDNAVDIDIGEEDMKEEDVEMAERIEKILKETELD